MVSLTLLAGLIACGGGAAAPSAGDQAPTSSPPPDPVALPAGATACDSATGRVLEVGPGRTYSLPSQAAAAAQAGDVVRIAAGIYRGDVATWRQNNLTICGVGGRAHLYADGKSAGGKAIWVVAGANITIDSMSFHDAKVPDRNGAGIRAEHTQGDLRILNSGFHENENGILSAAGPVSITIENSEFARSCTGSEVGLTHNLYIGKIDRLTVRASYFHETLYGHNLKSRAKVSQVENSYFMDGVCGASSYLTDFPNGGQVVLRGNLFQKGVLAPNPVAIAYGAEGLTGANNALEMSHNTIVMSRRNSTFLRAPVDTGGISLTANLFASPDSAPLLTGGFALTKVVSKNNVMTNASLFPRATDTRAPYFWPDAQLLPTLALPGIADAAYLADSPAPYQLRMISGGARLAGALQSAP